MDEENVGTFPAPPEVADEWTRSGLAFAVDLYSRLSGEEGNIFYSPAGIQTAMAMAYAGARGGTAAEMEHALHLPLQGDALHQGMARHSSRILASAVACGAALHLANSFWGQKGLAFKRDYKRLLESLYKAGLYESDFAEDAEAARAQINAWVEKATKGLIRDAVPPASLDVRTRLLLINAIHFKADWHSPFPERRTEDAPFWLAGGLKADVPTMTQQEDFLYGERDGVQVLEMLYAGGRFGMAVLLPKEKDGLPVLERGLTADRLVGLVSRLESREVEVHLPKFKAGSSFQLAGVLAALGMPRAFSTDADFSGMSEAENLRISDVVHKAFVDVDEKGTEAAAVTALAVMSEAEEDLEPEPIPVFRADHPFLFLIRDRGTGAVLFLGRLADPR